MGLVSGSASFVRFGVEGDLPENSWDFIADRVSSFSFVDIDDGYDEYSIGWVSVLNMFDSSFSYNSFAAGDYVVLSLRVDERKVSPVILKKFVAKEEERVKSEKQIPKIPRAMKVEIKERVHTELIRKSIPVPSVYDLYWSLTDGVVMFFTTNKKAHVLLEDFFKESFGLLLKQQIPYIIAENILEGDQQGGLELLKPDIFL